MLVAATLSVGLLYVWESGSRLSVSRQASAQAFYLAQAAIELAKAKIDNDRLSDVSSGGWWPGPDENGWNTTAITISGKNYIYAMQFCIDEDVSQESRWWWWMPGSRRGWWRRFGGIGRGRRSALGSNGSQWTIQGNGEVRELSGKVIARRESEVVIDVASSAGNQNHGRHKGWNR